ncbi:MAG TPA: EAL domain-containing protein [Magnetospirillum sp.]|nr:EAL domain-containing protein [Magnetospirillum sp.]
MEFQPLFLQGECGSPPCRPAEIFARDQNAFQNQLIDAIAESGLQVLIVDGGLVTHFASLQGASGGLGYSDGEIAAGLPLGDIVHATDRARVMEYYHRRLAGESDTPRSFECGLLTKGGERRDYEVSAVDMPGACPLRVIYIGKDVTDRFRWEAERRKQERLYQTLAENSPDMIVRYDRNCRRLYVNPAASRAFGCSPAEMTGKKPTEFPLWSYAEQLEQKLTAVFASGNTLQFGMEWSDGTQMPIVTEARLMPEFSEDGSVESVLGIFRDVTEAQLVQKKLYKAAFHDALTGVPNRLLLDDRLHQAIADAAYHGRKICLMMIDVDRFKSINDTMGHGVGDQLLREMAGRLTDCLRSYDTVARLGGDEFVILMPEVRDGVDLGRIADKILRAVARPYALQGKEFCVSASIGIAIYPGDSTHVRDVTENARDLLMYADVALYHAKRQGRNNFQFYSAELTEMATRNVAIEMGLRHALSRNEFEVHFQPKVSFETDRVIGSEALLRWRSPHLGMVPPDQFIPIAEDTGLIVEIGAWVLHEACRAARDWNAGGMGEHKVAINLSARQFLLPDLVQNVSDVLAETGCRPEWIELEITETLLLDKDGRVAEMLSALQSMGITIAIDDFGTGYSSLSYLGNYSIDTLKIDKSFIQAMDSDSRRSELVKAILSIAECLGQKVVAEGVETFEQVAALKKFKCHFAQGWYYAKPLPKTEITPLLSRQFDIPLVAG